MIKKYNINIFKYIFFILVSITFSQPANSDLSTEELIKGRKAIFSKNYSTAKKVQTFASKGDFERAKSLMLEMSENYKNLLEYFPENSKEGFKTEALPAIWENKDEFNNLMTKSSNDMIQLTKIIETSEDIKGTLGNLMWTNCKACHSKFRAPH
jgi:cytochrome c556